MFLLLLETRFRLSFTQGCGWGLKGSDRCRHRTLVRLSQRDRVFQERLKLLRHSDLRLGCADTAAKPSWQRLLQCRSLVAQCAWIRGEKAARSPSFGDDCRSRVDDRRICHRGAATRMRMMDRYIRRECSNLLGESTLERLSKEIGMFGAFQVGIPLSRFKGGRGLRGWMRARWAWAVLLPLLNLDDRFSNQATLMQDIKSVYLSRLLMLWPQSVA